MKSEPEYPPTRLREILNVVIRIFAIYLGLSLFTFLLQVLAGLHNHASSVSDLLLIGLFVVFTLWLWYLSPLIARKLTWARDSTLDCGQLTLGDLYCFAFLLVGLYFAVDSFGPSLTWLHYTLSQSSSDAGLSRQQQGNYYTLFKYLVRLMLGIGLILNGRKFATRLIKHQNEAGC